MNMAVIDPGNGLVPGWLPANYLNQWFIKIGPYELKIQKHFAKDNGSVVCKILSILLKVYLTTLGKFSKWICLVCFFIVDENIISHPVGYFVLEIEWWWCIGDAELSSSFKHKLYCRFWP